MLNLILFMMLFLLFIQLIQSVGKESNINIFGHFAGLLYGFFLAFLISPPDHENTTACFKYLYWRILSGVICGGSLIAGIVYLAIIYSE